MTHTPDWQRRLQEADLTFDEKGLIPAIVQEKVTGQVLMMAYMNRESLEKTLETGQTWFYSRSRQELWHKGATSGHVQKVHDLTYDCDADTLLVTVTQTGVACHTGEKSCFFNELYEKTIQEVAAPGVTDQRVHGVSPEGLLQRMAIIPRIVDVLKDRREDPQQGSYTNYLFDSGIDKILKKVGEESAEVIIAAKNPDNHELVCEISDLVYHVLVLMNERGVSLEQIMAELTQRHGKGKNE